MPKRKRRSSVFSKRKSRKSVKRKPKARAKLRGSTRSIATRALRLAATAASNVETKRNRIVLVQNQVPIPVLANYIAHPTEIGVGLGDQSSLGTNARIGNEIRATGLKLDLRVVMQHNAGSQGTLSTWNGEQRVRLVVGRYMKNINATQPSSANVFNQYPSVFYNTRDWEQEEASWGRFPQYRDDPADGTSTSSAVAKFKIIYQRELVFNSFTIGNGSTDLYLGQDGTNVNPMGGIPTRKPYPDFQRIKTYIPLDHKVLYSGNDGDNVEQGCIGVWLCQHDATAEYGTGNLKYYGNVDFYYKDG